MDCKPLVSVIIPTYNRSVLLMKTIDSVLNQTYNNIEIIVVDDGSQEDLTENLNNIKKLKYYRIPNSGGPSKPRNLGIKKSNGKYIAFIDDDDLWVNNKIEIQVNKLEKNKEFGLAHNYCSVIDEFGKEKDEIIGKSGSIKIKHGDVVERMIGNWTLMTSSVLLRKELVDKVGFFNCEMPPAGEDVEYWSRCSFHSKFYYLDKPLVLYRKHTSNISKYNVNYVDLPLHLYNVIKQNFNNGIITQEVYKKLKVNICKMQIKMIKKSINKTIINIFKLDFFWFLKFKNLKLLTYIILAK